ncbi:N-acetyltransferase [Olivibacter sp. SDN3]|uniref:GNAT family N-acetyltransferase n=1 Tax=Olivibacter sp. SDN3 TaxID=2764720 RepID=UPI001650ED5C|nr:N-acetyltransferase [Olivibacter sp. SDN3]QNL48034.1 N-acetyltransferase [Olivibacter sp. SDN3]
MNNIIIRKEQIKDYREIYEVNKLAFNQNDEAKLVDALRRNKQAFIPELSLVAITDQKIVGHSMFTEIQIVNNRKQQFKSLALAPVAVKPDFQNKGIGSMLIRHGFEVAKQLGYKSVIVLGHQHYYPKFGFLPAKKRHIKAPFDVPENVFMAVELEKDGLKGISGTVRYPPEFESV